MNKMFRFVRIASPAALVAYGASAHAALPTDVTSALDGLKADGVSMATAVLLAIVAIFAIKFLRKGL